MLQFCFFMSAIYQMKSRKDKGKGTEGLSLEQGKVRLKNRAENRWKCFKLGFGFES